MFCRQCGASIPDDGQFCPKCGSQVPVDVSAGEPDVQREEAGTVIVTNAVASDGVAAAQAIPKKKNQKLIAIIIAAAAISVILAIGIGAWQITGRIQLKEELMRDWSSTESKDGVYYKRVLDFSEDEIEYKFRSSMVNSTMSTYDYKVISPRKIKVYWSSGTTEVLTIEFDEDKEQMKMTPALTQSAEHEYWYNLD